MFKRDGHVSPSRKAEAIEMIIKKINLRYFPCRGNADTDRDANW